MRTHAPAFTARRVRRVALVSTACLIGGLIPAALAAPAGAATFTVTEATEEALREAFDDANASGGSDTIVLPSGAAFTLEDCDAGVLESGGGTLVIEGNGATITQTCEDGVLAEFDGYKLTVRNLTVENGVFKYGGNIYAEGDLVLESVTATGGGAGAGGNVAAFGAMTITDSVITGGIAEVGGGVYSEGAGLVITNTTIADNEALGGGGIYISAEESRTDALAVPAAIPEGDQVIENSAIIGNEAVDGGGIASYGSLVVVNSTIARNEASSEGGGIYGVPERGEDNVTSLHFATVAENSAPEGANITTQEADLATWGSVIALPQGGGQNCSLFVAADSTGYNWSDDVSCKLGAATDVEAEGVDPLLGVPLDNGGGTETMMLIPGSPLKNAIPTTEADCGGTDQRAIARPQGAGCDIGAVEVVQPSAAPGTYTTPNTQALTIDVKPLVTDPDGVFGGDSTYRVTGVLHGTIDAATGGIVTYTPAAGYVGTEVLDYEVCDQADQICVESTLTIDVTGQVVAAVVTPRFTG
jgi:hypothetical protein